MFPHTIEGEPGISFPQGGCDRAYEPFLEGSNASEASSVKQRPVIHERLQLCCLCLTTGNGPACLLEKRKQCPLKGRTVLRVVQLIPWKMHIGAATGRLTTDQAKLEQ